VAFTYDETDLSTDLAKVRTYLGDVDSDDPIFSDEVINAYLGMQPNLVMATAALCDAAAAKFARKVDVGALSASRSASQLFDHYTRLADRLRKLGAAALPGGSGPGVGGIRVTGVLEQDIEDARTDDTYTNGPFSIGMDNHPGGFSVTDDDDC
jgi:hypothetical protein